MEKYRENRVHFIPALGGDCTLLEFDNRECILIDCGYKSTYNQELKSLLLELNKRDYKIKLFIVSHIDADHIQGAIELLKDNGEFNNPQVILLYGELFQCSKVRLNYLDLLCFIHDILI